MKSEIFPYKKLNATFFFFNFSVSYALCVLNVSISLASLVLLKKQNENTGGQ